MARFRLPNARPSFPTGTGASTATDFYSLLAAAVGSATSAIGSQAPSDSDSGTLIPPNIQGAENRISFISAQRERLAVLMSALDTEAMKLKANDPASPNRSSRDLTSMFFDGTAVDAKGVSENLTTAIEEQKRPGSAMSGLSKSRSEGDFEKIEHDFVDEGDRPAGKRTVSGGWMPWAWSKTSEKEGTAAAGKSSGVDL
jgi:receptor expression-enhancing protein 1/2/3/4